MRIADARSNARRSARAKVQAQAPYKQSVLIVLPYVAHRNRNLDNLSAKLRDLGAYPLEVYEHDGREWRNWRLCAGGRSEAVVRDMLRGIGITHGVFYGSGQEMSSLHRQDDSVRRTPPLHRSQSTSRNAATRFREGSRELWAQWCAFKVDQEAARMERVNDWFQRCSDNPAITDEQLGAMRERTLEFRQRIKARAVAWVKSSQTGREPVFAKAQRKPRWHGPMVGEVNRNPNRRYLVEAKAEAYMESIGVKV